MTSKRQRTTSETACFIVPGYGIPKDIFQDQNYEIYLRTVFNRIFSVCRKTQSWNVVVVFCGGKTDMVKPYRRTEAQEMIKYFRELMLRPAVKPQVKAWKLIAEAKSLSTLDNFLFVRGLLSQKKINAKQTSWFCEQTRAQRILKIAQKLSFKAEIVPIDFDQTANRYLDPEMLRRVSDNGLKLDLWAMKNEANLAKHRSLFKEKIAFLRAAGPDRHVDAVREWWEKQLATLTP